MKDLMMAYTALLVSCALTSVAATPTESPSATTNPAKFPNFAGGSVYDIPGVEWLSGQTRAAGPVFTASGESFYQALSSGYQDPSEQQCSGVAQAGTSVSQCAKNNVLAEYDTRTGLERWNVSTWFGVLWMEMREQEYTEGDQVKHRSVLALATPFYMALVDMDSHRVLSNLSVQEDFASDPEGEYIKSSPAPFWSDTDCLFATWGDDGTSASQGNTSLVHYTLPSFDDKGEEINGGGEFMAMWNQSVAFSAAWQIQVPVVPSGSDWYIMVQKSTGSNQFTRVKISTPSSKPDKWCEFDFPIGSTVLSPGGGDDMFVWSSADLTLYYYHSLSTCTLADPSTVTAAHRTWNFNQTFDQDSSCPVTVNPYGASSSSGGNSYLGVIVCGPSAALAVNNSWTGCLTQDISQGNAVTPIGDTTTAATGMSSGAGVVWSGNQQNGGDGWVILQSYSGDLFGYKAGSKNGFAWKTASLWAPGLAAPDYVGSSSDGVIVLGTTHADAVQVGGKALSEANAQVTLNVTTGQYVAIGWLGGSAVAPSATSLLWLTGFTPYRPIVVGVFASSARVFMRSQTGDERSASGSTVVNVVTMTTLMDSTVSGVGIGQEENEGMLYVSDQTHFYVLYGNDTSLAPAIKQPLQTSSTAPLVPMILYGDDYHGRNTKNFVLTYTFSDYTTVVNGEYQASQIHMIFYSKTTGKSVIWTASADGNKCPGDKGTNTFITNITADWETDTYWYSNAQGKCLTELHVASDATTGEVTTQAVHFATSSAVYGAFFKLGHFLYYGDASGLVHYRRVGLDTFGKAGTLSSDFQTSINHPDDKGGAVKSLLFYWGEVYAQKTQGVAAYGSGVLKEQWYSNNPASHASYGSQMYINTTKDNQPLVAWNGRLYAFSSINEAGLTIWEYDGTSFSMNQKPLKSYSVYQTQGQRWQQGVLFDWGLYVVGFTNGIVGIDLDKMSIAFEVLADGQTQEHVSQGKSWTTPAVPPCTSGSGEGSGSKVFSPVGGTVLWTCGSNTYTMSVIASGATRAGDVLGTLLSGGSSGSAVVADPPRQDSQAVAYGLGRTLTTGSQATWSLAVPPAVLYRPGLEDFVKKNKIWIAGVVAGVLVILIVAAVCVNAARSKKTTQQHGTGSEYVAMQQPVNGGRHTDFSPQRKADV